MAKKKSKKLKRRLVLFGTLSIVSIIYFLFNFSYHVYTLIDLQNEKRNLNHYYAKMKDNTEELEDEIKKFSNKEYLAKYARENYLYSTDNEYIIKITKDMDNDIKNTEISIKKEYIISILSGIMLIIFIYILKKGFSNKKNSSKKR